MPSPRIAARFALLAIAMCLAIARQPADVRQAPDTLRYLTNPDTPPDEITREDRQWAAFAARENLGRGPVGYVDEYPRAVEADPWRYARVCYYLAPTIVVLGRSAERVIVNRPDGPVLVAGHP